MARWNALLPLSACVAACCAAAAAGSQAARAGGGGGTERPPRGAADYAGARYELYAGDAEYYATAFCA